MRAIIGMATKKYAPFVPIPTEALPILKNIKAPSKADVVYDLGCGDGKVLLYLADQFPQTTYIGIEYGLLPYILAKIKTRNRKNISIRFENFFKTNLSNANMVIVYLYPSLMDSLLPKLRAELRSGSVVYSLDFAFTDKKPDEIGYNTDQSASRGKRLLTYRF